jgi:flavodoxin
MKRALVVYESMWGNTAEVARAIAKGLATRLDVSIVEVAEAPAAPDDVAIIVAGGPTHAFSMTRENTRADAIRQGAQKGHAQVGLREWLSRLPDHSGGQPMVTFDTRVGKVRHLPGSAAKSAGRVARQHGYARFADSESFYVDDVAGPLLDGETARATHWGELLANRLMEPS